MGRYAFLLAVIPFALMAVPHGGASEGDGSGPPPRKTFSSLEWAELADSLDGEVPADILLGGPGKDARLEARLEKLRVSRRLFADAGRRTLAWARTAGDDGGDADRARLAREVSALVEREEGLTAPLLAGDGPGGGDERFIRDLALDLHARCGEDTGEER